MQEKRGEVADAFIHPELGPIAFVYGNEAMGLHHIEVKRGMVWVNRIPEILRTGRLERDAKVPRAYLVQDSNPAKAAVIRLDWDGEQKTWLVTAHPDDVGKWSGGDKTSRTATEGSGLVQGNPSQSTPQKKDVAAGTTMNTASNDAKGDTTRLDGDIVTSVPATPASGKSSPSNTGQGQQPTQTEVGNKPGITEPITDRNTILPGDIFETTTGRHTTPYPNYNPQAKKAQLTKDNKAALQWLKDNAIAEAQARSDDFNLLQFQHLNIDNWSQADSSVVNSYLFGDEAGRIGPRRVGETPRISAAELSALDAKQVRDHARTLGLPVMEGKRPLKKSELIAAIEQQQKSAETQAQQAPAAIETEAAQELQAPTPLEYTPKQYHEAMLQWRAAYNNAPLAEIREDYDTPAGRDEHNNAWVAAAREAAKRGDALTRQTLDKLHELNPNALRSLTHDYPNAKLPNGYQTPDARKAEAQEKQSPKFSRSSDAQSQQQRSNRNDQRSEYQSGIPAGLPAERNAESAEFERGINGELRRVGQPEGFRAAIVQETQFSDELGSALGAFRRATGTRVAVFRNLTPEVFNFNGVNFRDGVAWVNETSEYPLTLTAAHEWVHNLRRTDPALYQELANEVVRQGDLTGWAYVLREQNEGRWRDMDVVTEELTAAAVSDALTDPAFLQRLAQRDQSAFKRVARAFLDFLNTLTAKWKDQGSNAYLQDVEAFRDKLEQVLDALPQQNQQHSASSIQALFQRVWHGTPHRGIEKTGFKLNAIGTGEGVQAYGWGMYFAGAREVAEVYLGKSTGKIKYKGKPLPTKQYVVGNGVSAKDHALMTLGHILNRWQPSFGIGGYVIPGITFNDAKHEALQELEVAIGYASSLGGGQFLKDLKSALRELKQFEESDFQKGQLYSANIPEDSDLLDWDKPLSKQPVNVQEAVGSAYKAALNKPGGSKLRKNPSGMQFYEWLSATKGGPQRASEYLQSLGIPGLRYQDGSSRSAGEGSHNYVIWDEALLTPEAADIQAMFSRSASTQAAYESRIDALFAGEKAGRVGVKVLDRSDVLGLLGFNNLPLVLRESKVIKGKTSHPAMTAAHWKKVPQWIENPAAVFDSATVPDALVFIAPELVNGSMVLVTVEPDSTVSASLVAHEVTNAYDKDGGLPPIHRWVQQGLGRYVDQKTFPAVAARAGLQLSGKAFANKPGMPKILTEKNLAGWRRANNTQQSFAGQQAQTADQHALSEAQARLDAGADPEQVRQDTGWHKGADGKWRFEISDADAKLHPNALQNLKTGGWNGFRARAITYRTLEGGSVEMVIEPQNPQKTTDLVSITIPQSWLETFLPADMASKVKEGQGQEDFIGDFEEASRIQQDFDFGGFDALPLGSVLNHPALFAAYPQLRDLMVQVDPKLGTSARYSTVDFQDGSSANVITLGTGNQLSALLHEIQHGIQHIEGFATGGPGGAKMWLGDMRPIAEAEYRKLVTELTAPMSAQEYAQQAWQTEVVTPEIQRDYDTNYLPVHHKALKAKGLDRDAQVAAGWRAYQKLAGEVEARNTQARQRMTDEQRRATPPSATADVADGDVIVTFNGKEMHSAPKPANAANQKPIFAENLQKTPVNQVRAAITKAYGKLLDKLESKGLVTLTQTQEEAIDAAAQARAAVTGKSVESVKQSLMASVKQSWEGGLGQYQQIAATMIGYADAEGALQFGRSDATDIETIAKDVGRGRVKVTPEYYEEGNHFFRLIIDGKPTASMSLRPSSRTVEVNTAAGKADGGGKLAMAVAYEWAFNNGYKVVPNGSLTKINTYRWTESMLSAALRHGTTEHMGALEGVQNLHGWSRASDVERLALLLKRSYENTIDYTPSLAGSSFDQASGRFLDSRGNVLGDDKIREALGQDDVARARGIGVATFKKALVIESGLQNQTDTTALANALVSHQLLANVPGLIYSQNGAIEGFHDPVSGKTFLIADALTEETAPGTLMHEVGIHMAADSDGKMQKLIARAGLLRGKWQGNEFVEQAQSRMEQAGETSNEEFLAYVVTQYENGKGKMPMTFKLLARDFIAAVRAWLHSKGWLDTDSLTVADLAAIARANAKRLANNPTTGPDGGGKVRHSTAEDAITAATQDAVNRWQQALKNAASNPQAKEPSMSTPAVLRAMGAKADKLVLPRSYLAGIKEKHTDIPADVLENLPAFLADPLFIVPHKLGGLRVFIQAETAKGEPIAVGVSIDSNGRIQTVTPIHNHPDQTGKERMYLAVAMAPPGRIYAKNKEALGKAIASARASAAAAPATIALHRDSISSASVLTRVAVVKAIQSGKYKGDVRFSRAAQPQPMQQPVAQTAWQSPSASKFDDWVYQFQDKHIDTKRLQESLKAVGKSISDDLDVYLQETLFHGRAAKRTQDFVHDEITPLVNYMKSANFTIADVEEFLHARHAPEANAIIAQRDPSSFAHCGAGPGARPSAGLQ